ncbi:hypothetical protein YC2023_074822 [Brassica napus]
MSTALWTRRERIELRGRFLKTLPRRRLLLVSSSLSLPFPQRISNLPDQIPFIFDGVDPEEEDAEQKDYENSDEEDGNHGVERYGSSSSSVFDFSASHSARDSGLPSANDVFSQISGPPEFLNNRTEVYEEATARDAEHAKRMTR